MAAQTSISFIRHGAVYNPEDLYYGRRPGFPLSEEGRREALAVTEALKNKPIAAIYSSPLQRALETAEIIRKPHPDLSVRISELLIEVYSPFDGCPLSDLIARNWNIYEGVDPPYEQPMDVLRRAQLFVKQARQDHHGRHVVAVTHGDLIAFMILWSHRIPITAAYREELQHLSWLPNGYLAPASISTFVYKTTAQDERPAFEYTQIDATGTR
jgi:broad specificity phosphatase PhoE